MDFNAALGVLQQRASTASAASASATSSGDGIATLCSECLTEDEQGPLPKISAADLAGEGASALLRLFFQCQEERVSIYRRFEEGFRQFMEVQEADGYQALVKHVTASFSAVSMHVNRIEQELGGRDAAAKMLATMLRAVQNLEREKLQITAQLHIVRHGLGVDALLVEKEEEESDADKVGPAARTAALRAEEEAELAERLARLTEQLNDALDEIRSELCDLSEDAD
jgi:hypothetical protein